VRQKNLLHLLLWIVLSLSPCSHACRYTVREIGFSQAQAIPYRLVLPMPDTFSADLLAEAKKISQTALADANITAEIVRQGVLDSLLLFPDNPAVEKDKALLISPLGQWLSHPFSIDSTSWKSKLWELLDWACLSPLRKEINDHLGRAYCVVLLLQSDEEGENARSKARAMGSIEEIIKIMPNLPKPISQPPVLLEVNRQRQKQERLLLWSLGADTVATYPRAAVIYGRVRRLGPILQQETFTEANLVNLLALIGADCECGLDRSWILGVMLPSRWGDRMQQAIANELGFDVENPSVRMEMEQILTLDAPTPAADASHADFLAGYREGLTELLSAPVSQESNDRLEKKNSSFILVFIVSFISLSLLLLAAALLINWKMKKKNRL